MAMRTEGPDYHLFVSRHGNVFMSELASLLQRALADLGCDVTMHTDSVPERGQDGVNIIVAPHEFFHFMLAGGWSVVEVKELAKTAVCVTTEQPGTPWFDIEVDLCEMSPLLLDINRIGARELAARGLRSRYLQLGYHPSMDVWRGREPASASQYERQRDVAVLAAKTDRRTEFLAAAAPMFWDRECDVRLFTFEQPIVVGAAGFLSGPEKWSFLADTKVLLNVHRSDFAYFEWLRVIEAIANGCVLVTETSLGHQPLIPFEHFVQAPLTTLAEYAAALLVDEAWRNEISDAAYEFCRSELNMTVIMADMLPEIEEAVASGQQRGHAIARPGTVRPAGRNDVEVVAPNMSRAPIVDPGLLRDFRREAKRLIISQRAGIRDIEKMQAALTYGSDDHVETEATASFSSFVPEVSVVLTNYNYSHLVTTAMASVWACSGVRAELIVVDDHSNDESVAVIERAMASHPWFPTCLVKRKANRGLSEARNLGFEHARSDYVFVLDADNLVYPNGLNKLLRVLEVSDESFAMAYGIIDCFRDTEQMEPVGLVSCLPWDPYRLTRSNYIDAMALIRKQAWQNAGGYDWSMDEHFGGWEDFDLWLRFASRGYSASFVASPVARYRVHGASMLHFFNWAPEGAVRELRRRYPDLPWPPWEEGE